MGTPSMLIPHIGLFPRAIHIMLAGSSLRKTVTQKQMRLITVFAHLACSNQNETWLTRSDTVMRHVERSSPSEWQLGQHTPRFGV